MTWLKMDDAFHSLSKAVFCLELKRTNPAVGQTSVLAW